MDSRELARIQRALARAEQALGDLGEATRWLSRPNPDLDGRPPLELLESEVGALDVERALGRIEHGD